MRRVYDGHKPRRFTDNIMVIQSAGNMCGGTDETLNTAAPKEIESGEMFLFSVNTSLNTLVVEGVKNRIMYINTYAVICDRGVFVYYEKDENGIGKTRDIAILKDDIFPGLIQLAKECGFAKRNGRSHYTHGLPENFGGTVDIRYESGEKIHFSDNQSPLFGYETVLKLASFFEEALKGERAQLPKAKDITSVYFERERSESFCRALLTINEDGTGINKKTSKYKEYPVNESEKAVDAECIGTIRKNIDDNLMTGWTGVLKREYSVLTGRADITFTFRDGSVITVSDGLELPYNVGGAFFNIELELTSPS